MAKCVDIIETTDDGQRVAFTLALDELGRVLLIAGDLNAAKQIGIGEPIAVSGGRKVWPETGLEYLEGLSTAYSGSRWRATRVYG